MNGAHGGKELLDNTQKIFGDIPVVDCTCSGNRVLTADAGELRQGGAGAVSGLDTEADSGTGGVRDTAGGETGGSEVPPHNKENIAVTFQKNSDMSPAASNYFAHLIYENRIELKLNLILKNMNVED